VLGFSRCPETGQDHAVTSTQFITTSDLERLGSDARFELIQGVLYEMPPSGYRSNLVLSEIGGELRNYVKARQLGRVTFGEAGYVLERNPDTVVVPDVAFVRRDRIPDPVPEVGLFEGPPDLIVEVISPTDEQADIRRKQALYDRIGIPLVWWIDPKRRTATVHAPDRPVHHLTAADSLDGESVVPGFSIPLVTLFDF
jgi:Uma2 family endonuclease